MTVSEFVDWCIEPSFLNLKIYDSAADEIVFDGCADDICEKYIDYPIESFDVPLDGEITVNIWTDGC